MVVISETAVAVRFFGGDLDPDALTFLLGANPTSSARKGDFIRSSGQQRAQTVGKWVFSVARRTPGDLEGQLREVFASLSSDMRIWRDLAEKHKSDIFVGLFLKERNEGMELSAECLSMLAERGLRLNFDIYTPWDEERP